MKPLVNQASLGVSGSSRRRHGRWLPASGGLVGVAVAVAAGSLVLSGAYPLDPVPAAVVTDGDRPEPDLVQEDEAEVPHEPPVITQEITLDRDPFDPVVPEDEPDDAIELDPGETEVDPDAPVGPDDPPVGPLDPTGPDDPDAPVAPGDPLDPDAPPPAGPSDPAAPDEPARCVGEQEVVCNGQVITFVDRTTVDAQPAAVIQVGESLYDVREGEMFAEQFRLLRIEDGHVVLQLGDQVIDVEESGHTLK